MDLKCLERIGVEVVDVALTSLGDYAQFKTKETSVVFIRLSSSTIPSV